MLKQRSYAYIKRNKFYFVYMEEKGIKTKLQYRFKSKQGALKYIRLCKCNDKAYSEPPETDPLESSPFCCAGPY